MLIKLLNNYKNLLAVISIGIIWQITSIAVNEPLIFPNLLSVLTALYDLIWIQKFLIHPD